MLYFLCHNNSMSFNLGLLYFPALHPIRIVLIVQLKTSFYVTSKPNLCLRHNITHIVLFGGLCMSRGKRG